MERLSDYDPTAKFFSKQEKNEIKRRQNGRCGNCGSQPNHKDNGLQIHHRVPRSMNGSEHLDNGVALDQKCHQEADMRAFKDKVAFPDTHFSELPDHFFQNGVNLYKYDIID